MDAGRRSRVRRGSLALCSGVEDEAGISQPISMLVVFPRLRPRWAGHGVRVAPHARASEDVSVVRRLLLSGVIMLCLLTACSSPGRGPALLRGYLVWPAQHLPMQFRPEATAGLVRVLQRGRVVTVVSVWKTGRFTVEVPPGSYSLTGVPTGGFPGVCSAGHVLHARNGEVISVHVNCHLAPGEAPG